MQSTEATPLNEQPAGRFYPTEAAIIHRERLKRIHACFVPSRALCTADPTPENDGGFVWRYPGDLSPHRSPEVEIQAFGMHAVGRKWRFFLEGSKVGGTSWLAVYNADVCCRRRERHSHTHRPRIAKGWERIRFELIATDSVLAEATIGDRHQIRAECTINDGHELYVKDVVFSLTGEYWVTVRSLDRIVNRPTSGSHKITLGQSLVQFYHTFVRNFVS